MHEETNCSLDEKGQWWCSMLCLLGFSSCRIVAEQSPLSASTKRRRLQEEFDGALDALGFVPSAEESSALSVAMRRRRGDPVVITVFMKVPARGSAFALGFSMENGKDVKDEMLKLLALSEGHFQPFFINDNILSRRPSRSWPDWPRPAWYHSAFCTIADVAQLRPALLAYRAFFDDLGFDVELKTINLTTEEDMETWRVMQPPREYLKRVEPEGGEEQEL